MKLYPCYRSTNPAMLFAGVIVLASLVAFAGSSGPVVPIVLNPGGIGGVYKGPNSETIVKGPDGSVIKSAESGGEVHTSGHLQPIIVAEPGPILTSDALVSIQSQIPTVTASVNTADLTLSGVPNVVSTNLPVAAIHQQVISSSVPVLDAGLSSVALANSGVVETPVIVNADNVHVIETELVDAPEIEPDQSSDLLGPSGSISTRGSSSIVSGPASTTISEPVKKISSKIQGPILPIAQTRGPLVALTPQISTVKAGIDIQSATVQSLIPPSIAVGSTISTANIPVSTLSPLSIDLLQGINGLALRGLSSTPLPLSDLSKIPSAQGISVIPQSNQGALQNVQSDLLQSTALPLGLLASVSSTPSPLTASSLGVTPVSSVPITQEKFSNINLTPTLALNNGLEAQQRNLIRLQNVAAQASQLTNPTLLNPRTNSINLNINSAIPTSNNQLTVDLLNRQNLVPSLPNQLEISSTSSPNINDLLISNNQLVNSASLLQSGNGQLISTVSPQLNALDSNQINAINLQGNIPNLAQNVGKQNLLSTPFLLDTQTVQEKSLTVLPQQIGVQSLGINNLPNLQTQLSNVNGLSLTRGNSQGSLLEINPTNNIQTVTTPRLTNNQVALNNLNSLPNDLTKFENAQNINLLNTNGGFSQTFDPSSQGLGSYNLETALGSLDPRQGHNPRSAPSLTARDRVSAKNIPGARVFDTFHLEPPISNNRNQISVGSRRLDGILPRNSAPDYSNRYGREN